MKISRFEDEQAWKDARRGKITGTRLKDLIVKRGNGKKIGYYELIAERLAVPADDENAMERGLRLEEEALERLEKEKGIKVIKDLVIWQREDNESIALSPDAYTEDLKTAVEVKCLGSQYHIKVLLENKIPSEYWEQVIQYFVVNDKLEKLYFVFYDPRIPYKEFFSFEVLRKDVEVEEYLELEKKILQEIEGIVNEISGF